MLIDSQWIFQVMTHAETQPLSGSTALHPRLTPQSLKKTYVATAT